MRRTSRTALAVVSGVVATAVMASAAGAAVTFVNTFTDAAGTGFFDPTFGAQRQAAFQAAENVWSNLLVQSQLNETIEVNASFPDLGGTAGGATLGSAGAAAAWVTFTPAPSQAAKYQPNTVYVGALANHLAGTDLNGNDADIQARFNSRVDTGTIIGGETFYYGTDGNVPANKIDFMTVVLHELGHGLGFAASIGQNGTFLNGETLPYIFDRFLYRGTAGQYLTARSAAQRAADITSGDLFFNGTLTDLANGGNPAKLFAPATYQPGSSASHIDQPIFDLMNPVYPGIDHTPSARDLGILADIGWDVVPVPEPMAGSILIIGAACTAVRRQRRQVA